MNKLSNHCWLLILFQLLSSFNNMYLRKLELLLLLLPNLVIGQNITRTIKDTTPRQLSSFFFDELYKKKENNPPRAPLANIIVEEIGDTFRTFSWAGGKVFSYCGDVEGAICNLLGTPMNASPNVRFVNKLENKRYVFISGNGSWLKTRNSDDVSNCDGDFYVDSRGIIMSVLSHHFNFNIEKAYDSLWVYSLKITDKEKLFQHQIPLPRGDQTYEQSKWFAPFEDKPIFFMNTCLNQWPNLLEYRWNVYFDIFQGDIEFSFFNIQIPSNLLTSSDKYLELKQYFEQNYGLTIERKKEQKKIYNVTFKEF